MVARAPVSVADGALSWPGVLIRAWFPCTSGNTCGEGGREEGGAEKVLGTGYEVKDLHAKIGELAVANDFLSRKLKPWGGT